MIRPVPDRQSEFEISLSNDEITLISGLASLTDVLRYPGRISSSSDASIADAECRSAIRLLDRLYQRVLDLLPADTAGKRSAKAATSQRKKLGAWYTPDAMTKTVLDEAIDPLFNVNSAGGEHRAGTAGSNSALPIPNLVRVLDPACGSGRMLRAAAARIADRSGISIRQVLCESIFGIDIDPIAVALARLSLLDLACDSARRDGAMGDPDAVNHLRDAVCRHVRCASAFDQTDAMLSESGEQFDAVIGNPPYVDSESGVAIDQSERASIARVCPLTTRGNWDLFIPFIEIALRVIRPSGGLAMVLPRRAVAADYAAAMQELLMTRGRMIAVHDFGSAGTGSFEDASISPIILAWRSHSADENDALRDAATVRFVIHGDDRMTATAKAGMQHSTSLPPASCADAHGNVIGREPAQTVVTHDLLAALPPGYIGYPLALMIDLISKSESVEATDTPSNITMSSTFATTRSGPPTASDHLRMDLSILAASPRLGDIADVRDGATTGEAYAIRDLIFNAPERATSSSGAEQPADQEISSPDSSVRLINTGTIDPYVDLWGRRPVRYLGFRGRRPAVDLKSFAAIAPKRAMQAGHTKKVFVAGMATRLEATVATAGDLCGKSAVLIMLTADGEHVQTCEHHATEEHDDAKKMCHNICPHALAAVLNSAWMNTLYRRLFGHRGPGGRAMCIGPRQIRQLPLPPIALLQPADDEPTQHTSLTVHDATSEQSPASEIATLEALLTSFAQQDLLPFNAPADAIPPAIQPGDATLLSSLGQAARRVRLLALHVTDAMGEDRPTPPEELRQRLTSLELQIDRLVNRAVRHAVLAHDRRPLRHHEPASEVELHDQ
ncbi:MAG: Eco57I restriction-modification methylase domain-containing protein [Planctomycetota bacterium]